MRSSVGWWFSVKTIGAASPRMGLDTVASSHAALFAFFFFSLSLLFFTGAAAGASSSSSLSTGIHSTGCRLHHGQSGRQICARVAGQAEARAEL